MANPAEITMKLVTFTEPDCKILVEALGVLAGEYPLHDQMARIDRLIERLS